MHPSRREARTECQSEGVSMIDLVMTVCLLASPAACREERSELENVSVISCMTQGQFYAARWADEHPAYRISRWRCEPISARQAPI